jgi:hypothetical protein
MLATLRVPILILLVLVLAACSSSAASVPPSSSGEPSADPSEEPAATPVVTPDFGAIEHPTGATDVVLRFEEGGGFMMAEWIATQAPSFTLYGDGTIVVRDPMLEPLPAIGSVTPMQPFRTSKLTEEQVQDLLAYALGEGGLGAARPEYRNDLVADASTAVFTVDAGGLKKTVSVYALGMDQPGLPDAPARAAFAKLADRLQGIDRAGTIGTTEYEPERYRGILLEGQPGAPDAKPWPWTGITPADFVSKGDPNAFQMPTRVLSIEEVEALGIGPVQGGFHGLTLIGPDGGKVYSFSLRPLLPTETE